MRSIRPTDAITNSRRANTTLGEVGAASSGAMSNVEAQPAPPPGAPELISTPVASELRTLECSESSTVLGGGGEEEEEDCADGGGEGGGSGSGGGGLGSGGFGGGGGGQSRGCGGGGDGGDG